MTELFYERPIHKKASMATCWVPGVNHHGDCGRWAISDFTDLDEVESQVQSPG